MLNILSAIVELCSMSVYKSLIKSQVRYWHLPELIYSVQTSCSSDSTEEWNPLALLHPHPHILKGIEVLRRTTPLSDSTTMLAEHDAELPHYTSQTTLSVSTNNIPVDKTSSEVPSTLPLCCWISIDWLTLPLCTRVTWQSPSFNKRIICEIWTKIAGRGIGRKIPS